MSETLQKIDPVEITRDLIRCKSITPIEGGALDYLQNVLEGAGITCHRLAFSDTDTPDVDNLYARIGTQSPNLCFAGHTDVVPTGDVDSWSSPPFSAEIKNDILFGRGAADMKGGIACFLAAALRHIEEFGAPKNGSISFLITGDEEGPAINGTVKMLDWLTENGEILDHCIVGEPSNTKTIGDTIKIGRRGSLNGILSIEGKQGHVAYPHLADNPIPGLLRVLASLLAQPLDRGTEHFMPSNLEVTSIDVGNGAENIIPAKASARFNIRFNDSYTGAQLMKLIKDKADMALKDTEFSHSIKFRLSGESFLTKSGPLTTMLVDAIASVTGEETELSTSGGTSDARFIKNACPVIEFGLINATIHKIDEQVPVNDLHMLTDIFSHFIKDYFSAGPSS